MLVHHHHHHDAKRSAVAFRRCDLSPKRAVFCQLQSVGHWYSCVPADLMDPGNGRSTTSAFPIRRWSGTVLGFAASPKDLVCLLTFQGLKIKEKNPWLSTGVETLVYKVWRLKLMNRSRTKSSSVTFGFHTTVLMLTLYKSATWEKAQLLSAVQTRNLS